MNQSGNKPRTTKLLLMLRSGSVSEHQRWVSRVLGFGSHERDEVPNVPLRSPAFPQTKHYREHPPLSYSSNIKLHFHLLILYFYLHYIEYCI
jgi:hypothetical protein